MKKTILLIFVIFVTLTFGQNNKYSGFSGFNPWASVKYKLLDFYPEYLKLYVVAENDNDKYQSEMPSGFNIEDLTDHQNLIKNGIDDSTFHSTDPKGFTFDGVNDALYIATANADHLQMQNQEMTILIVYNNNNLLGGGEFLFSFGLNDHSGDYSAYFLTVGGTTDRLYWRVWDDSSSINTQLTDARLRDNNNHILILRKYYSGGDSYVKVDCPDLGLSNVNHRITDNEILSNDNFVLNSRSLGDVPIQGLFYEYAFWIGKSMSDAEITWLYENCYSKELGLF